ncbi:MAG: oligoendopeptidase F, partial [Pseudomonadota bacterium]
MTEAVPLIFFSPEASSSQTDLGTLPEWDLTHLYESMDAPALKADLDAIDADAKAFAEAHAGKLAETAADPAALLGVIEAYEDLSDRIGRVISYAGLVYAGDTSDTARAKFYGDIQERITNASTQLLFFTLELNTVDDAVIDAALEYEGLSRYRPWFEDVRKERPYQL